jgi:maltodextrin utilization protein YvdJ
MMKRLLVYAFSMAMLMIPASMLKASEMADYAIEQTIDEEITIAINGQSVTISGAQGQTLEVISLTGRKVMTVKIESPAQRIDLNVPKGCYILKIGKFVRKVSLH